MKTNLLSHQRSVVRYGAYLAFAIFLYFYLHLFQNALIDDAFITLHYAKTLTTSGTWGLFPGVISNSATSPLNVLLLSLISFITGPTVEAPLWLYLLAMLCITFLLLNLSSRVTTSEVYGWLGAVALVFNPLLISTIGLESIIFTALFVLTIYCYQLQNWTMAGVALGLLTLSRPDGILFFILFLLFAPDIKTRLRLVVFYLLSTIPWYLYSWIYLGSLVPDTFFIKTEQGRWWESDFFNGITNAYYYVYPLEIGFSFVFLPLVTLLVRKNIRRVMLLVLIGLAGLFHFIGYSLLGVPPFHWYYVPQVITIILLGSLGLGVQYRESCGSWERKMWGAATAVCFLIPVVGMFSILARSNFFTREMPIHSNWATYEQYKEIGLWLKEKYRTDTIRLEGGEIATLIYHCDCRLLDQFSDRRWLKDYITKNSAQAGIKSALIRINFAFYAEPEPASDTYVLRAFFREPTIDAKVIREWQTSTKWLPHGFLILSPQ